jgi:hypothetical protein
MILYFDILNHAVNIIQFILISIHTMHDMIVSHIKPEAS